MATERIMPATPQEWQEAADMCEFWISFDSARKYGLVTGGPDVNVSRALELKLKALNMGIRPRIDAVERSTRALMAAKARSG